MLWKTHLAFGFLSGLFAMSFVNTGNIYIFFVLVLFGALLPDIDNPNSKVGSKLKIVGSVFKHRGIFHSLLMALLIGILVWVLIGSPYGAALLVGYTSHLVIDGFTKAGINFLHPVAKLHLSGFIETGKAGEWIAFSVILIGILFKLGIIGWLV